MSSDQKPSFDASAYWNRRYQTVDVTKSGHVDLPAIYNTWLYRRKQSHFAKAMKELGLSLSGARLLEVAAGSGAWMNFWKQMGIAEYLGIDLSERAVAALVGRFPDGRFKQYDLNDGKLLETVGEGYDCVTAIDVLYHVLDDKKFKDVIKELASVMKPGATLVLHDVFPPNAAIDHGQYIRWRTLSQNHEALAAAGLEVVYRRPSFVYMVNNLHFKGATGAMLDMIWKSATYPIVTRLPNLAGFLTNAVDSLVCRAMQAGPSMELMVCRKKV